MPNTVDRYLFIRITMGGKGGIDKVIKKIRHIKVIIVTMLIFII